MDDLISRKWLMEVVEEGWIKFDTQEDYNRIIHLVRDIAPSAQPTAFGYSIEYLIMLAITMQKNKVTPQEANGIMKDIQRVVEMVNEEYEKMLNINLESILGKLGGAEDGRPD